MQTISGDFDTGEMEITCEGETILSVCLIELNQHDKYFQCDLNIELERSHKRAFELGILAAKEQMKEMLDTIKSK